MKITLLVVGKIKEDWLKDGIKEYQKRISKFCDLEICEVADSPDYDLPKRAMEEEGRRITSKIKDNDFVIALDLHGEKINSDVFSKSLEKWFCDGGAKITFIIAGSNGYHTDIIKRANARICLSDLTFTHQMTRLIILEQIFRAFKISGGEKYHK